ncbi:hypothetical protein B0I37DRAFT_386618 [Chaetomium sp. MPI-CAGE-AT-0009]|nr:hypothetical protein B0I37DRAFT_386618 [Chaetomium sp. MPI-CAGE-AT-0009]
MEPPPGWNTSCLEASSIRARLPPTLPETSHLVFEAKARMEEIEFQRDEESAAMSNRLHALVAEYKRRDQSFVDRYTKCLEQLSCLTGLVNTHPWATPCRGVVDREIFYKAGVTIKFYPDTGPFAAHGDSTDEEADTPRLSPTATTNKPRNSPEAPSFSPLSNIHCSPKPTPKPVSQPPEARPRKRPKRSPSPDELALDSSSSPSVGSTGQKVNGPLSRTPQQAPSRKPLPTHGRRKQTTQPPSTPVITTTTIATSTTQPRPPSTSSSPLSSPSSSFIPPTPPPGTKGTIISAPLSNSNPSSNSKTTPAAKKKKTANRRGPPAALPCLECRRRKVRCSRGSPQCERCERMGRACSYPDV